jgi:hypothetical protein
MASLFRNDAVDGLGVGLFISKSEPKKEEPPGGEPGGELDGTSGGEIGACPGTREVGTVG